MYAHVHLFKNEEENEFYISLFLAHKYSFDIPMNKFVYDKKISEYSVCGDIYFYLCTYLN
jgi:hypothetical protein